MLARRGKEPASLYTAGHGVGVPVSTLLLYCCVVLSLHACSRERLIKHQDRKPLVRQARSLWPIPQTTVAVPSGIILLSRVFFVVLRSLQRHSRESTGWCGYGPIATDLVGLR